MLHDRHGRKMEYLRVSLTDACNFRCGFCDPAGKARRDPGSLPLTLEERLRLCRVFSRLGVVNYKITGGEPFMSPLALPTLERLKADANVRSVTVTTNGSALGAFVPRLAAIGVDGVNVSLNAMTEASYRSVVGCDFPLAAVLDNILSAKKAGLKVKVNMVPMRGVNDGDIPAFLAFALENDLHPRFIELMPIAHARDYRGIGFDELIQSVAARFGRVETFPEALGNGPASYFSVAGYGAKVGFIAAVSREFCSRCNRVRLTAGGFLKTCLHHPHGADLAGALREGRTDEELSALIRSAVRDKPEKHRFSAPAPDDAAREEPMYRIGG